MDYGIKILPDKSDDIQLRIDKTENGTWKVNPGKWPWIRRTKEHNNPFSAVKLATKIVKYLTNKHERSKRKLNNNGKRGTV